MEATMVAPTGLSRTGHDLCDYLEETGSGAERVQRIRDYLATEPDADAAQTVEWMIAANLPHGTCRKAGEWAHGPTFTMKQVGMRKQDELADLRQELSESKKAHREEQARLSAALRRSNARCAQLESARDHLQLRTADLPLRTQGEEDETASVGELDLNKVAALRAKLKNRPGASQE
mgnify:CR=1 FL=1